MTPTRTLYLDDLLSDSGPLTVMGVKLDAQVKVVLRQTPFMSEPEVDSIEVGEVYMACDSLDEVVLLDQTLLKTRHKALYREFEAALCVHALNRARIAPDGAWEFEEEMP